MENLPGIIPELKADATPAAALAQIREREYAEKLKREQIRTILAVGLSYDLVRKEHACVIEEL